MDVHAQSINLTFVRGVLDAKGKVLHATKSEDAAAGTNTAHPSISSCHETNNARPVATETARKAFPASNAENDDGTTPSSPSLQPSTSSLAGVVDVVGLPEGRGRHARLLIDACAHAYMYVQSKSLSCFIPLSAQGKATENGDRAEKDQTELDLNNSGATVTEDVSPHEETVQRHEQGPRESLGHRDSDAEADADPGNEDDELKVMKARACAAKLKTFFRVRGWRRVMGRGGGM